MKPNQTEIIVYQTSIKISENKIDQLFNDHSHKNEDILINYLKKPFQKDLILFINLNENNFPYIINENFTFVSFNDYEFEVLNRITKQNTHYNISSPFDEFQIAKNIKSNIDNCIYPDVCLNDDMFGCDNHNTNILYSKIKIKHREYIRKSPISTFIL
jgi:hypothetical protein